MKFEPPEGMEEYLQATDLCNWKASGIQAKADSLTENSRSPKAAALAVFAFVRDAIPYKFDFVATSAADTLQKSYGPCVTKTNLQVALLRAVGIPCRFHQVVLHKSILKGIVPDSFYKNMPERIWYHPWCEPYLSGSWIACDTVFDKALYDAACGKNVLSREKMPTIEWDGENDLISTAGWILEDAGTHASYDGVSRKAQSEFKLPDFVLRLFLWRVNRYIDSVRRS